MKVPVSALTIFQRINRKLRKEGKRVRKSRPRRGAVNSITGQHFVVRIRPGSLIEPNVDLEKLAQECGVLKPWEKVVEDGSDGWPRQARQGK